MSLVGIVLFDVLLSEGMAVFVVLFLDKPVLAVMLLIELAIEEVTIGTGLAPLSVWMIHRVMMWKPALVGTAPNSGLLAIGLNLLSLSLDSNYCHSRSNSLAARRRLEGEAVRAELVVVSVALATSR